MWFFRKKQKINILLIIGFIFGSLVFVNIIIYFFWSRTELKLENISAVTEAEVEPLVIRTDKEKYSLGEVVKIFYSNQALKAIAEASSTRLNVDSSRFLGRNYGVGLIEQYLGGKWLAIEPVWRCSMECFSACTEERLIPRAAQKTFYWKQTMLICSGAGEKNELASVGPGRYRVVSAVWDNGLSDYKIIYSNQFEIK